MNFNDYVGVDPTEISQDKKDDILKICTELYDTYKNQLNKYEHATVFAGLQEFFAAITFIHFQDDFDRLKEVTAKLAIGLVANVNVLISQKEEK